MFRSSFTRAAALAAVLGTLAIANASFAADTTTTTSGTTTTTTSSAKTSSHKMMHKAPSPEDMKAHVEERISTLHDKLMITAEQETAWGNVAQAMRDNEETISGLIQTRHETSVADRTAIDDLESYQKIAQAHADGLSKVTSAFESLYNDMSDDQKKNADKVFGNFEGRGDVHKAHYSTKHKSAPAPAAQ